VGETVKINDGPFLNFSGVIEEIDPDKGKLKVTVNVFGRNTPVELEYWKVKRKRNLWRRRLRTDQAADPGRAGEPGAAGGPGLGQHGVNIMGSARSSTPRPRSRRA
jgi:hypothetical protein